MRRALTLTFASCQLVVANHHDAVAQDTVNVAQEGDRSAAPSQPLFESHEILDVALKTPDLEKLIRDIDEANEDHPATLTYLDPAGDSIPIPLEVETRGHFRRQRKICNFPPLKLELPDSGTEHTVFVGQGDLKLVTHCQDKRDEYEQSVLQEYLIYRIYNLLTERSFRVRLAKFTYIDEKRERDPLTKYAFLIEDHEMLAARNGCRTLETQAHPLEFSPTETARMAIFQYMIGNTDWSIAYLHNVKLLLCPDYEAVAVPYDFDWSGVIDARYAKPDEKLPIRSVRDRLFRGFCRPEQLYRDAAQAFLEHKDEIYALYRSHEDLDPKVRKRTLEYYDEFYRTLTDRKRFKREILDACRRA